MTKPAKVSSDPLIMKVRAQLKKPEPRQLPVETAEDEYGHTGWKCPYCGGYVRRRNRVRYGSGRMTTSVDYGQYNMHFAAMHGTPFWREKQLIALLRKELT